ARGCSARGPSRSGTAPRLLSPARLQTPSRATPAGPAAGRSAPDAQRTARRAAPAPAPNSVDNRTARTARPTAQRAASRADGTQCRDANGTHAPAGTAPARQPVEQMLLA